MIKKKLKRGSPNSAMMDDAPAGFIDPRYIRIFVAAVWFSIDRPDKSGMNRS